MTFPRPIAPAIPIPANGVFKTGITFTDSDSVIGSQGSGGFNVSSFSGTTGIFEGAKVLTNTSERPMDYLMLGGKPLLATIETNGNTTSPPVTFSTVRVYDLTTPETPVLVASGRTATTYIAQGTSGGGTGAVAWGKVAGNSATLYAISALNGIQAFTVTITVPVAVADPPLEFLTVNLNAAAGTLTISWASAPGRTYRLEASENLVNWTPQATGVAAGAGSSTTYAWTTPPGFTTRAQVRVVRE